MANLLCEFRVVFPIDGFTGFDRFAVCSGLVCGQCSHLVARRHVGPGSDGLIPVTARVTRVHRQGCPVRDRWWLFPLQNPAPALSHPQEPC